MGRRPGQWSQRSKHAWGCYARAAMPDARCPAGPLRLQLSLWATKRYPQPPQARGAIWISERGERPEPGEGGGVQKAKGRCGAQPTEHRASRTGHCAPARARGAPATPGQGAPPPAPGLGSAAPDQGASDVIRAGCNGPERGAAVGSPSPGRGTARGPLAPPWPRTTPLPARRSELRWARRCAARPQSPGAARGTPHDLGCAARSLPGRPASPRAGRRLPPLQPGSLPSSPSAPAAASRTAPRRREQAPPQTRPGPASVGCRVLSRPAPSRTTPPPGLRSPRPRPQTRPVLHRLCKPGGGGSPRRLS